MSKNVKIIFLVATLLFLLVGVSAISASEVSDDTTVLEDTTDTVASEVTTTTTDNKIVDTTTKNIKKEEQTTDLYVSDTDGSDDNSGTNTSPYKTIQKALDTTTADSTYNIHLAEGTYKGLGNTNLTVNGNYNINIMGDGINKTIIDGEANYTILDGNAWGNSEYWNTYKINYGNWAFNISHGTGLISIRNLNIQNMVSRGGSSINSYETATVDNYGNLLVDTVYFKNNLAGVGGGIRNNNESTVKVNNSIFEGNRKSSSTGNDGAGIYNNGTAIVENSQFIKNAARWGTVTNDHILNITNCTFKDGISYDLGSTYKMGSGIAIDTGDADFYNTYTIDGIVTIIKNCNFENNSQTDIYQGKNGDLLVDECNFNKSTGITITSNTADEKKIIQNSRFTDLIPSSLFGSLSVKTGTRFAIYTQGSNLIITNNTINFEDTGYAIYAHENNVITNNNISNIVILTGNKNNVTNNTIITRTDYTIELNGRQNKIINNTLITEVLTADKSISSKYNDNTLENNIPITGDEYTLSEDTYSLYFDENGIIKTDNVINNSVIKLGSHIYNKNFTFNNTRVYLSNPNNYILYNSSINIINSSHVILNKLLMNNSNNNEYVIYTDSEFTTISSSRFNITTTNNINAIIIKTNKTKFENNQLILNSTCDESTGVIIESNSNILNANTIIITNNKNSANINGIIVNNSYNNNIGTNITLNGITTTKSNAIFVNNSDKNELILPITINQSSNTTAIQLENSNNNYIMSPDMTIIATTNYGIYENNSHNNEINLRKIDAHGTNTYGIISNNSINTTITAYQENMTMTLNGTIIRAIQLINASNTNIQYIIFNTNRNSTRARDIISIDAINSTNVKILNTTMNLNENTNIIGTLLVLNNTNNTYFDNLNVYSLHQTTPIQLINANNNTLTNLNITAYTTQVITLTNSNNNNISYNYLNGNQSIGGNSTIILTNSENNILTNNVPAIVLLTEENYEQYFTDNLLNPDIIEITLDSDLYNKNMNFNNPVTIYNPNNYTLYNSTITSNTITNQLMTLNNLIFNSTNNKITLINSSMPIKADKIRIYHENPEDILQTIILNSTGTEKYTSTISNSIITSIGQEKTEDISSTMISNHNLTISNSNITLKSNNDVNGKIIGIQDLSTSTGGRGSGFTLQNSNLTITGNNEIIGLLNPYYLMQNTINITGNNATSIITNKPAMIYYSNFNMNANYSKGIIMNEIVNVFTAVISPIMTISSNNFVLNSNSTLIDAHAPFNFQSNKIYANNTTTLNIENITTTRQSSIFNNEFNTDNTQIIITNTSINIQKNNIKNHENITPIIIKDSSNSAIYMNYLETPTKTGNFAIDVLNSTDISVYSNEPGVVITEENYDEYFTNGLLTKEKIDIIELGSDLYNKNMTFNTNVQLSNPNNYTLYNSTICIEENTTGTFTNLIINNTDDRENSIINKGSLSLTNSIIYHENQNKIAQVIYSNTTNGKTFTISQTNMTMIGNGTLLNLGNGRTDITYNNMYIKGDNVEAIYMNNNDTSISSIQENNITIETNTPTTAIEYINTSAVNTRYNTILISTNNYETPIIYIENGTNRVSLANNYIESYDLYGINAISVNGTADIKTNNQPSETGFKTKINEIITPENIIKDIENIINVNITDSFNREIAGTITITDGEITTTTETTNIIYKPTSTGNKTLTVTYVDPTGKYNTTTTKININIKELTLTVDPITATVGETINITARITADNETMIDINKGKVTFKVNGKTLKDANGKVIYAKIINGVATIENYLVPDDWAKEGTTIQAVYSGSIQCDKLTGEKTEINIEKAEPTLTTNDITATAGETITLTATITDNNKVINTGKVVFKINGKTVKDANGKVIYAKVVNNQVNVEYTLPADMKDKEYNITVTFISSDYDKLETTATMTIVKS